MPDVIDPETPDSAKTRTGYDGEEYELVFSDEFNTDGRTFYPGDDPFWEAADIWYGSTQDQEWYDPKQITTQDGYLRILMESVTDETINHMLPYRSGMLQSWNKFCFSSGYIEVSLTLPGGPDAFGYVRLSRHMECFAAVDLFTCSGRVRGLWGIWLVQDTGRRQMVYGRIREYSLSLPVRTVLELSLVITSVMLGSCPIKPTLTVQGLTQHYIPTPRDRNTTSTSLGSPVNDCREYIDMSSSLS